MIKKEELIYDMFKNTTFAFLAGTIALIFYNPLIALICLICTIGFILLYLESARELYKKLK